MDRIDGDGAGPGASGIRVSLRRVRGILLFANRYRGVRVPRAFILPRYHRRNVRAAFASVSSGPTAYT